MDMGVVPSFTWGHNLLANNETLFIMYNSFMTKVIYNIQPSFPQGSHLLPQLCTYTVKPTKMYDDKTNDHGTQTQFRNNGDKHFRRRVESSTEQYELYSSKKCIKETGDGQKNDGNIYKTSQD